MKIRLCDFKCYKDESFDFGEEGMALLSGPSGQGKSSIIQGIYFALFGVGSKVAAYGKTSCKVELEFDGMKVVRTKRPNRLVVDDVYEDDAAQDIINKRFGDTFDVTGYISQNALNSFILMNPMDKLGFLEKFAFKDVDLSKIKGRCKGYISKANEELLTTGGKLSQAKQILEEMDKPDKVDFPLKCKAVNRDKAIKNEEIRSKNCKIQIKKIMRTLCGLEREINDIRVLEATLASRKETLSSINEEISKLESSEVEYEGDEYLEELGLRLKGCIARRRLVTCEEKYRENTKNLEEVKSSEIETIKEQIYAMEAEIWNEYTKDELNDTIEEQISYVKDLERLEKLKSSDNFEDNIDIEQMRSEINNITADLDAKRELYNKMKQQENVYHCPCCASSLRFSRDVLVKVDDVMINDIDVSSLKSDISSLTTSKANKEKEILTIEKRRAEKLHVQAEIEKITSMYEEISDVSTAKDDLEYLREYRFNQLENERKLSKLRDSLENEKFSRSYNAMQETNISLKGELDRLRKESDNESETSSEEELQRMISVQEKNREKVIEIEEKIEDLLIKRESCREILEKCEKTHKDSYGEIRRVSQIEKEVTEYRDKISELEENKSVHDTNLIKVSEWREYNDAMIKYESWEKKLDNLKEKEKEDMKTLASANTLKDKIMEAESIAMLNIIDSINTHAQLYLECFFPENPISVRLQPFKQTKKNVKPQINIEVEYKGMECDLNMLSGGELSRVILAYTLALAEMFNTPLLLLDECTASLDQELTGTVFEGIKDHFNGKLALIIAHQVVTGTFDTTVNLGGGIL